MIDLQHQPRPAVKLQLSTLHALHECMLLHVVHPERTGFNVLLPELLLHNSSHLTISLTMGTTVICWALEMLHTTTFAFFSLLTRSMALRVFFFCSTWLCSDQEGTA
jgi:hypothetical protein